VIKTQQIIQVKPDILELERQHALLRKPLNNDDLIVDHFAIQRLPREKMVVHSVRIPTIVRAAEVGDMYAPDADYGRHMKDIMGEA
jgi:hypothetical protein